MTPEERKRDKYYRRTYGVGLDWWEARFAEQGGKCGICRRPQEVFKYRLAIDHAHGYKRVVIQYEKTPFEWHGKATYCGMTIIIGKPKKAQVSKAIKAQLKAMSCRGLLCPHCNRGLRFYQDCPIRMANAAEYLRKHQNA